MQWRPVLVPPEGTPEVLRERVIQARRAVTDQLAVVAPQALAGGDAPPTPDPELTALSLQAISEEGARMVLDRPDEFSIERIMAHAGWMLGLLGLETS